MDLLMWLFYFSKGVKTKESRRIINTQAGIFICKMWQPLHMIQQGTGKHMQTSHILRYIHEEMHLPDNFIEVPINTHKIAQT